MDRPSPTECERFITVQEFADLARLSRRRIDRLRLRGPPQFPREYKLGSSEIKFRRCPRFKLSEALAWIDTRRFGEAGTCL